jgi:beta-barrel assembly-enhancing protease
VLLTPWRPRLHSGDASRTSESSVVGREGKDIIMPFQTGRRRFSGRMVLGLIIAAVAIIGYFARTSINPVTGQKQRVALSVDQEVAMGLQAAPEMAQQFGGLDPDPERQELVDRIGGALVDSVPKAGQVYPFEFHVLADTQTVNAFALPGGQVFITSALLNRLDSSGQLAGVLAHEIGHAIERHSAEHLAKARLTQGLSGAIAVGTYDPDRPSSAAAGMAAAVAAQMITLKYGRSDELEADRDAVQIMARAGYDPRAMIEVMKILHQASGGRSTPEWLSSHPDPGNRIEAIEAAIREQFPRGVPQDLKS